PLHLTARLLEIPEAGSQDSQRYGWQTEDFLRRRQLQQPLTVSSLQRLAHPRPPGIRVCCAGHPQQMLPRRVVRPLVHATDGRPMVEPRGPPPRYRGPAQALPRLLRRQRLHLQASLPENLIVEGIDPFPVEIAVLDRSHFLQADILQSVQQL